MDKTKELKKELSEIVSDIECLKIRISECESYEELPELCSNLIQLESDYTIVKERLYMESL